MLTICRHWQTLWNKKWRLQWHKNSPLTQEWITTAIAIGNILKADGITAIYSSPLQRAHDTSKVISNTQNKPHPEIKIDDRLKEMSFWTHEWLQRSKRDSTEVYLRDSNPFELSLPWGENYRQVQERVESFLKDTDLQSHDVIVAHEALNRMLIWSLAGMEDEESIQISQPNSVIYRVVDGKLYHNNIWNDDWWIEWVHVS